MATTDPIRPAIPHATANPAPAAKRPYTSPTLRAHGPVPAVTAVSPDDLLSLRLDNQ